MTESENESLSWATACQSLAEFAINREAVKTLTASLPSDQNINQATVEYELQLLRIVTTGWSISVYMRPHEKKHLFEMKFWELIREFSKDISNVTALMIGKEIDYFDLVKDRFHTYLGKLQTEAENADPAVAIGPAFAKLCQQKDNPFLNITGARIFNYSVRATKEYLEDQGLSS